MKTLRSRFLRQFSRSPFTGRQFSGECRNSPVEPLGPVPRLRRGGGPVKSRIAQLESLEARELLTTISVQATTPNANEQMQMPGVFTFTASGGMLTQPLTVQFTESGTALAGTDYQALPGSITLQPGQMSSTLNVTPLMHQESANVTVVVTLSPSSNYTLGSPSSSTVTIVEPTSSATLQLKDGSTTLSNNGNESLGTTTVGTQVTKTLTLSDTGTSSLQVSSLAVTGGFSLSTSGPIMVNAGQSTTFTVTMQATSAGSPSGQLTINSNDAASPFHLNLSGTVNPAPAPQISLADGSTSINDNGGDSFGTTPLGTPVQRVFNVSNPGNATLTLGSVSLPSGFSLVGAGPAASVAAGGSTSFTVAMNATAAGSTGGQMSFSTNVTGANPFVVALSGTVTVASLAVLDGFNSVANGGSDPFGATFVGIPLSKSFTVKDQGTATLTLGTVQVPAGFSLTTAPASTVAPNGSTSFTLQYPATAAGSASGTVQFSDNDPNNNPFSFAVSAQAVAPVASIGGVSLVNDTGLSNTDQITSDPRVSGTGTGNFAAVGGTLDAQFQYSTDGGNTFSSDGSATIATSGAAFTFDPRTSAPALTGYEGPLVLEYRPLEYDAHGTLALTGAWATFTLTLVSTNAPEAYADSFSTSHAQVLAPSAAAGVTANDTNGDGGTLTVDLVSGTSDGTLVLNSDGSFDYSSNPGFLGTDHFSYQLHAGANDVSNVATVTILVTNAAPLAVDDSFEVVDNQPFYSRTSVLANDSDADNDPLAPILVGGPTHGTLVFYSDGTFDYTPDPNFLGQDDFTYVDQDPFTPGNTATVSLDVYDPNSVARNDVYSLPHDRVLNVAAPGVLANDGASGGVALTASLVSGTAFGAVDLNADGSFTYTPDPGFVGEDSFSYDATDGLTVSGMAVVTLNVINTAPVAADDAYQVSHDRTLTVGAATGLLANDSDAEGDALSVVPLTQPSEGTAVVNADGGFSFTPAPAFVGLATFTYEVSDGLADSAPATVTIDVTNAAPVAVDDTATIAHDQTLTVSAAAGVLANDTDADADALAATLLTPASHGAIDLNSDGSYTYVPDPGFVGMDSFTYLAGDGLASSAPATVSIDVVNHAPHAFDATYQTAHDTTLSVGAGLGVLSGDSDPDGDSLTSVLVAGPSHGTLSLASDGSFTYVPGHAFTGQDQFTYSVGDGLAQSGVATVTITVTNSPVVATADSYELMHDTTLRVPAATGLLAGIVDDDGDALTVSVAAAPVYGALALNADGSFAYAPNPGFSGKDEFVYAVTDGVSTSAALVTLTVDNPAPTANPDEYWVLHDGMISVAAANGILANDDNPGGDVLTPTVDLLPAHGTLVLSVDGSFVYRPAPAYVGDDTFTYHLSDINAVSAAATVTIHVTDQAPTADDQSYSTVHGRTLTVGAASGVLAGALDDDGDPLTVVLGQNVAHGALSLHSDGSFVYAPAAGFQGQDGFTFFADDGAEQSDEMTVTIDVTDAAPLASDVSYDLRHDTTLTVPAATGLLTGVTDADPGDVATVALVAPANNGTVTLSPDGSFSYAPDPGFSGTDTFSFDATDGMLTGNVASVTLTVDNGRPQSVADSFSVVHDHTLTVAAANGVLANDLDSTGATAAQGGDTLLATLVFPPSHGTISFNSDGSFVYVAAAGYDGPDQFSYRARPKNSADAGLQGNVTDVSIDVTDQEPTAASLSYTVNQGQTLTVSAAAGALSAAADPDGDALSADLAGGTSEGALDLAADGSFTFTPDASFSGTDTFSVVADDGLLQSAPATITITVVHVNQVPVLPDQTFSVHAGQTLSDNVLSAATDADGDTLTGQLLAGAGHGTATVNSDGSFTYVPAAGFIGQDSFTVSASDGTAASAAALITIDVTNTAPVAEDRNYTVYLTTPLTVSASEGALLGTSDADGDPLTAALVSGPAYGSLNLNADGSFSFAANPGFTGTDSFSFTADDPFTASAPATVVIHVTADTVVARPEQFSVVHDHTLSVSAVAGVLRNDWDLSGAPLTTQLVSTTSHGALNLGADGSFSYAPDPAFAGTDQFVYDDSDGTSTSQPVTVTISVTDQAPVAQADNFTVLHDHPLVVGVSRGVLVNDYDDDHDAIASQVLAAPAHGTLNLGADGSFSYTPNPGFVGQDSFTYTDFDGVLRSAPATVTIDVTDAAPVGQGTSYSIHHGQCLSIAAPGVLAFDYDTDLDPLSIVLVSTTDYGALNLNQDGSFNYTPVKLANGLDFVGTDSFTYKLFDGAEYSDPVVVTINVTNNAPTANPDFYAVHFGTAVTNNVLTNDVKADGDALTLLGVGAAQHGSVSFAPDGSFTYTPTAPASGQPAFVGTDIFSYTETDGAALVTGTVTIDERDNAPHAFADLFTTAHDTALSGANVLTNDWDPDTQDTIVAQVVSGPSQATSFSLAPNGTIVYTPKAGFVGNDSFTYRDFDGAMWSSAVTATIQVTNDPPHAVNDFYSTEERTAVSGNVLANDLNPDGDAVALTLMQGPANGTLTLTTTVSSSLGAFTYTPTGNFFGTDSFTYQIGDGAAESTATVYIVVLADMLQAMDDDYTIDHANAPLVVGAPGVLANDDSQSSLPITSLLVPNTGPAHGTLNFSTDGAFTYTPDPTFVGVDSFNYKALLADGTASTATVSIKVTKQAPVAGGTALSTNEDTALTITPAQILALDSDAGGTLGTITFTVQPRHGTIYPDATSQTPQWIFVPDPNFHGADAFTYTVTDNVGVVSNPAKITITVNPVADPVTANPDKATTYEDQPVTIDVLANDTAGDGPLVAGTTVALDPALPPLNGTVTVTAANQMVYTPNPNWFGTDRFEYIATDPAGNTSVSWVTVLVFSVNTPPATTNQDLYVTQGAGIPIYATGTDDNGTPVIGGFQARYIEAVTQPAHGTLTRMGATTLYYATDPNYSYDNQPGTESFELQAYDTDWVPGPVTTVTIHVTPIDHAPVVSGMRAASLFPAPVLFNVLAGASDPDPSDNGHLTTGGANPIAVYPTVPGPITAGYSEVLPGAALVLDPHDGSGSAALIADFEAPATQGWSGPITPPQPNPAVIQPGTYTDQRTGITVENMGNGPITVQFTGGTTDVSDPTRGINDPTAHILSATGSRVIIRVSGVSGVADLEWDIPPSSYPIVVLWASGNIKGQGNDIDLTSGDLHVSAGLNITAKLQATDISAFARHRVEYPVLSTADAFVSAGGDIPDVEAGGNVLEVLSDASIGKVKAMGMIEQVVASGDITNLALPDGTTAGGIEAGGDIGGVFANNITTNITSDGGNIGFGSLFNGGMAPAWFMSYSAGTGAVATWEGGPNVNAKGAITGNIEAPNGSINQVLAAGIGSHTIHARNDIERVDALSTKIEDTQIIADTGTIYSVQAAISLVGVTVDAKLGDIGLSSVFDWLSGDNPPVQAEGPGFANGVHAALIIGDTIHAGGNLYWVISDTAISGGSIKSGHRIWTVIAGTGLNTTVNAGTDLGQIAATTNDLAGTITVGRNLTYQIAAGHDMAATVQVTGNLGDSQGDVAVVADRDITGTITATGDIGTIVAGRNLAAPIQGRNIALVKVGLDVLAGANITAAGALGTLSVGRTLAANVTANGGDISDLLVAAVAAQGVYLNGAWLDAGTANGLISGSTISASGSIGAVYVYGAPGYDGAISGATITAKSGDISSLFTAGDLSATVTAFMDISAVSVGSVNPGIPSQFPAASGEGSGNLGGSLTATHGSISVVSSGGLTIFTTLTVAGSITANLTAGDNIGGVVAGVNIGGDITAGNSIAGVSTGRDLWGNLTAKAGSIGAATIAYVNNVTAGRNIGGNIKAKVNIGDVTAGGNVGTAENTIEATTGNLGNVTAGYFTAGTGINISAGGNIGASLKAGLGIGNVTALGGFGPKDVSTRDVPARGAAGELDAAAPGTIGAPLPAPQLNRLDDMPSPKAGVGQIQGTIDAGLSIGAVTAFGDIQKAITAGHNIGLVQGLDVGTVWALGDIAGAITAGTGVLNVVSWGSIKSGANLDAPSDVTVNSYNDLAGNVTSDAGAVTATSWGAITGALVAVKNITAWAYGDLSSQATSANGNATLTSWGTLSSDASGERVSVPFAMLIRGAKLMSTVEGAAAVSVYAFGGIGATQILFPGQAQELASIASQLGSFTLSKLLSLGAYAMITSGGTISDVSVNGAFGVDVVTWQDVENCQFTTDGAADLASTLSSLPWVGDTLSKMAGWVNILAKGDCDATVNAFSTIDVDCMALSGSYTSEGTATINAWNGAGGLGTINAANGVNLDVNGDLAGTVTSDNGAVNADVTGNDGAAITGAAVGLRALGNVTKAVESTGGAVAIEAFGNVTAAVTSDKQADVQSWGNVTGAVTAQNGCYANVFAAAGHAGNVTAGGDAVVVTYGNEQGSVTAGSGYIAGGSGNDGSKSFTASVTAQGTIDDTINSSNDVVENAGGAITGQITATAGSAVVAGGASINLGSIQAGGNVAVQGMGSVTLPSVMAANGAVVVWGGADVTVTATGNTQAAVSAATTANVNLTLTVAAPSDQVNVFSQGALTATVQADQATVNLTSGGDATLTIGGTSTTTTDSGGNPVTVNGPGPNIVNVQAMGDVKGSVSAVNQLNLVAFGGVSQMTAVTRSATSQLYAQAGGDLGGTFTSGNTLAVVALGAVTGTFMSGTALPGGGTGSSAGGTGSSGGTVTPGPMGGMPAGATSVAGKCGVNVYVVAGTDGSIDSAGDATGNLLVGRDAAVVATGADSVLVTAGHDASVAALTGGVTGTVGAGHDASVLASGDVTAAISGGNNASVVATGGLTADVTATAGDADVVVFGAQQGNVSAGQDASVVAGNSTGTVVATAGDASVVSSGTILDTITAGHDASASAVGPITGDVTGTNDADVFSGSIVTGQVEATAGAANVATGGFLADTVTAGTDVSLFAMGAVTGDVTAGRDVSLTGFDDLGADVSAGRDANLAVEGSLSGNVQAGGDATLVVIGDHSGATTAGGNVTIETGGGQTGNVTAGLDAEVVDGGGFHATVTAGGNAGVMALVSAIGTVTAGGGVSGVGNASLSSWGDVQNSTVTGGQDASAWAGGALDAVVTATAGDASGDAGSTANMQLTAGHDAEASAFDNLVVDLAAGNDADVSSQGTATIDIAAGGDVTIFTNGALQGSATAGGDIDATSLDALQGGFTAAGDITLMAVGVVAPVSVAAGGNAQVVAWGGAAGIGVAGAKSAFVFAYGGLGGTVTSSAGTAYAFSTGMAVASVNAATYATLIGLDSVDAAVTAGLNAYVFAANMLYGSENAARNAEADALGTITSFGLTAGNDATLWAIGDISTNVTATAGHDLWAQTYGDLSADLSATHDVQLAWARGNITGTIAAGNNVDDVAAYGNINAAISAGAGTSGGTVNLVEAFGPIIGSITAGAAIEQVQSHNGITATLSAPTVNPIDPYDHNVLTDYPATPAVSLASISATLAGAYRDLLNLVDQAALAKAGEQEALTADKAFAFAEFQPTIGDPAAAQAAVKESVIELQAALANVADQVGQGLVDAQTAQRDGWSQTTVSIGFQQAAFAAALHQAALDTAATIADTAANVAESALVASMLINGAQLQGAEIAASFNNIRDVTREATFEETVKGLIMSRLTTAWQIAAIFDPTPISDLLETIYYGATGNWTEMGISFGFLVFGTVATVVGGQQATNAVRAGRLANSLDAANDLRRIGKAGDTVGDVRSFYKAADHVDEVAGSLKGPAKGYCDIPGDFCFVTGTLVWMRGAKSDWAGVIDVAPSIEEGVSSGLSRLWTVILAGITAWQAANWRLRRKQEEAVDATLGELFEDDDDRQASGGRKPIGGSARGAGFQPAIARRNTLSRVQALALEASSRAAILADMIDPLDGSDSWVADRASQRGPSTLTVLDTRSTTCHRKPLEAQTISAATLKSTSIAYECPRRGRRQSRVGLALLALFVGIAAIPYLGVFKGQLSTSHASTRATHADNGRHIPRWPTTKRIEDVVVTDQIAKHPPLSLTNGGGVALVVKETKDRIEESARNDDAHDGWYAVPADDVLPNGLSFRLAHRRITELGGDDEHHLLGTHYVPGDFDATDVTRALWRSIDLVLSKPDGSRAKLSVGRPLWWLETTQAELGGAIDLAMHEAGIHGKATVTRIGPYNADSRELDSDSALVTGTIAHQNAIVWDLVFNGDAVRPLGVTANHPIFSKDRFDWVPAGDLRVNEQVVTAEGTASLSAKVQRAGRHNVYNIEVHRSHAYYVSQFGILAHNTGVACDGGIYDVGLAKDLRKNPLSGTEVHHVPQSREAELLIGDFNRVNKVGNEAAIRLPWSEHQAVNEAQRVRGAMASARDLLADEIRILRNNTNVPNAKLKQLIQMNKELHFWDYLKLQR